MINGTTVIKAKDTASAMEKVVRELVEDCVILSTKKVNGQVSITASNSKKAKDAVKKRYDKKKFANIYKFNSGRLDIKNNIINNSRNKLSDDKTCVKCTEDGYGYVLVDCSVFGGLAAWRVKVTFDNCE